MGFLRRIKKSGQEKAFEDPAKILLEHPLLSSPSNDRSMSSSARASTVKDLNIETPPRFSIRQLRSKRKSRKKRGKTAVQMWTDDSSVRSDNSVQSNINRQGGMDIWKACTEGDVWYVKDTIKIFPELIHLELQGRTPLYHACRCGHFDIVKLLLRAGASDIDGACYRVTSDPECRSLLEQYKVVEEEINRSGNISCFGGGTETCPATPETGAQFKPSRKEEQDPFDDEDEVAAASISGTATPPVSVSIASSVDYGEAVYKDLVESEQQNNTKDVLGVTAWFSNPHRPIVNAEADGVEVQETIRVRSESTWRSKWSKRSSPSSPARKSFRSRSSPNKASHVSKTKLDTSHASETSQISEVTTCSPARSQSTSSESFDTFPSKKNGKSSWRSSKKIEWSEEINHPFPYAPDRDVKAAVAAAVAGAGATAGAEAADGNERNLVGSKDEPEASETPKNSPAKSQSSSESSDTSPRKKALKSLWSSTKKTERSEEVNPSFHYTPGRDVKAAVTAAVAVAVAGAGATAGAEAANDNERNLVGSKDDRGASETPKNPPAKLEASKSSETSAGKKPRKSLWNISKKTGEVDLDPQTADAGVAAAAAAADDETDVEENICSPEEETRGSVEVTLQEFGMFSLAQKMEKKAKLYDRKTRSYRKRQPKQEATMIKVASSSEDEFSSYTTPPSTPPRTMTQNAPESPSILRNKHANSLPSPELIACSAATVATGSVCSSNNVSFDTPEVDDEQNNLDQSFWSRFTGEQEDIKENDSFNTDTSQEYDDRHVALGQVFETSYSDESENSSSSSESSDDGNDDDSLSIGKDDDSTVCDTDSNSSQADSFDEDEKVADADTISPGKDLARTASNLFLEAPTSMGLIKNEICAMFSS